MRKSVKIIIITIIILIAVTLLLLNLQSILYMVSGIDQIPRQLLDVQMDVTGMKPVYDIGEPITFSVHVKALGEFVPWPDFRIYKEKYVDNNSQPVYSRMYMTPFEPGDRLDSQIKWRENTWDFPLDDDTGNPMIDGDDGKIRFFEEGTYVLRVNAWEKQESLIEFQVIDSSRDK